MESKAELPNNSAHPDISLIRGGPFYRIQQATGLIRDDRWNLGRRVTFAIAVGWVPLFLMRALFNPSGLLPLLRDYRMSARMLIAVPVLLAGQVLMETRFRMILRHIYNANLLDDHGLASMEKIIAGLARLRDSMLPELVILLVVAIRTFVSFKEQLAGDPWMSYETTTGFHLTLSGWYAVVISATIFQFLMWLYVWKWLLWTYFAFKLSKLNLRLIPTHPDENGGLGFLGMTPMAFAPAAFAVTCVLGSVWRYDILHRGAHLMDFRGVGIVLVVVVLLIAIAPLAFFVPRLMAVRRKGILDYAIIGQMHSVGFHERWILNRAGHEADLISAPEVSTLCDYGQAYDRIEKLNPFPTDKGALIALALSMVLPSLPVILAEVPITVLLKSLLKALG